MTHYLILLRPARAGFPANATEADQRVVAAHFEYLKALSAQGVVQLAGRTDEAAPLGLVLVRAGSQAEAERVMRGDPAILNGLMKGELKPFRLALTGADGVS